MRLNTEQEDEVADLVLIQGCEIASDTEWMRSLILVDCNRVDVKANCNRDEIVFLCRCNKLHVEIIGKKLTYRESVGVMVKTISPHIAFKEPSGLLKENMFCILIPTNVIS